MLKDSFAEVFLVGILRLMKPNLDPDNRLGYQGDLHDYILRAAQYFGISNPTALSHLAEGYEDCNVRIETERGQMYVCKVFADNQLGDYSKTRREKDVAERLVNIMLAVRANGVNSPELIGSEGRQLFKNDGLVALCYKWVEGTSYFDLDRAPTESELEEIILQASLINKVDLQPENYHDIWAVSHIHALVAKVRPYLTKEDVELIDKVLNRFDAINIEELPKCLVHGDLTKGNVLVDDAGSPTIIDFSVTNWTTRIIELTLIVSNLMFDKNDKRSLQAKAEVVAKMYQQHIQLTTVELKALPGLCLAGAAMEFLGGRWRQEFMEDSSDETIYWLNLGRETLANELL